MSDRLNKLVEEQNKLWTRMQDIQRAAEEDNRDWTAEERTNWDAANERLDVVSGDIDRLERSAKREAAEYFRDNPQGAPGIEVETPEQGDEQRAKKYDEAFTTYMRHGMERCDLEQRSMLLEQRAVGIGVGSEGGGFLVPPGFRNVLSVTLKAYGGLLNYANVITTATGNPLQWPTVNDTGNIGGILAENTQISQLDMTFASRTLGAYVYTSNLVLVSLQLLQDSAFDLNTWLPRMLGMRIGRAVSAHLITGTGTGQPTGIVPGVTVGKQGATGQTLTVTYDDLIDLEHSLDPAYRVPAATGYGGLMGTDNDRQSAMFVMHDQTLKVIRKLKDNQGRPLWLPVPAPGFPSTINGWPYVIDQGMPVPGASNKTILFGDINAGFIVRQVQDVQMVRLTERYADFLQVGFFGFSRLDAAPDDPAAIRAYQHSAS